MSEAGRSKKTVRARSQSFDYVTGGLCPGRGNHWRGAWTFTLAKLELSPPCSPVSYSFFWRVIYWGTVRLLQAMNSRMCSHLHSIFVFNCILEERLEQAGSSLTLFADRAKRKHNPGLGPHTLRVGSSNRCNRFSLSSLAPVCAGIWQKMGERQPSQAPARFFTDCSLAGFAFVVVTNRPYAHRRRAS